MWTNLGDMRSLGIAHTFAVVSLFPRLLSPDFATRVVLGFAWIMHGK